MEQDRVQIGYGREIRDGIGEGKAPNAFECQICLQIPNLPSESVKASKSIALKSPQGLRIPDLTSNSTKAFEFQNCLQISVKASITATADLPLNFAKASSRHVRGAREDQMCQNSHTEVHHSVYKIQYLQVDKLYD